MILFKSFLFLVFNLIFCTTIWAKTTIVPKEFVTEALISKHIESYVNKFNKSHKKERIALKKIQILSSKKFELISNNIQIEAITSKIDVGIEDLWKSCEFRCRETATITSEDGIDLAKIPVYFEFEFQKFSWVFSKRIKKGAQFFIGDAKQSWVPMSRVNHISGDLEEPTEILGKIAISDIEPGSILNADLFEDPIIVRRNSLVTLRVVNGGVEITSRVKALSDGRKGEVIPFATLKNQFTTKQAMVLSENELQIVNL